jgi:hypothetical protein
VLPKKIIIIKKNQIKKYPLKEKKGPHGFPTGRILPALTMACPRAYTGRP